MPDLPCMKKKSCTGYVTHVDTNFLVYIVGGIFQALILSYDSRAAMSGNERSKPFPQPLTAD